MGGALPAGRVPALPYGSRAGATSWGLGSPGGLSFLLGFLCLIGLDLGGIERGFSFRGVERALSGVSVIPCQSNRTYPFDVLSRLRGLHLPYRACKELPWCVRPY